jgi:hypothetical protein
MIAVIQHHKNGGKVEHKAKDGSLWRITGKPIWDFDLYDYRAKPEPLVLWHLRTEGGEGYGTYCNRGPAEAVLVGYNKSNAKKLTLVKFVEVTE